MADKILQILITCFCEQEGLEVVSYEAVDKKHDE